MMKFLLSLLMFIFVAASVFADKPLRTSYTENGTTFYDVLPRGQTCISDSTNGLTYDTLTFWVNAGTEDFAVFIKPTQNSTDATDSLAIRYRSLPRLSWVDLNPGSKLITLAIPDSAGVTYGVIDWLTGYAYSAYDWDSTRTTGAEGFSPLPGKLIQFLVQGSAGDVVFYEFCFLQFSSTRSDGR